MISYLSGKILAKSEKFIILDTGGTGYKVFLAGQRIRELEKDRIKLFCYTNTKKELWEIYGFFSVDELELFEFLIGISGIGSRTALEASCIRSLDELKKGIENNDPVLMESLFALGQKKAQAIIFEIARKIKVRSPKKRAEDDEEAIRALVKLGFEKTSAKDAVLNLPSSVLGVEDKIKEVLKSMNKNN